MTHGFDLLLRGGLVFDGTGTPGRVADLGIRDGRVAAIAEHLDPAAAREVVDAHGRWVTPGFVDLHTHYDAEVEIAPALFESLRHGVTTVVTGSCSLSMAVGEPAALADMFCRVEGIPRAVVLPLLERVKRWDSPTEYIDHLASLPLGPNVACMLGHSTIRAAAMGMASALDKRVRPDAAQWRKMEGWLDEALDAGYLGLSISTLPWDKMDGDEFRSRPMPSVFARWSEYRRFARTLRRRGRVLQAVPNISTKVNFPLFLGLSAGLLRRPLKTMMISMMDVRADRAAFRLAGVLTRLFNRLLGADVRLQALPNVFDLWADGIDLVVFEEFAAGAAALHLQDELSRRDLLRDPEYRARFRKQWQTRWLPRAFHRNLAHSEVLACPDASLVGKSFEDIARARGQDAIEVFLDLLCEHGKALRWYTVMGNDRRRWLEWIVAHPDVLIGFSDAGAHLRNMAHYNFPLRLLRLVQQAQRRGEPFMTVERAVQRLTSEIAQWLGLDVGTLRTGARADLVIIDPEALDDRLDEVHEQLVPEYGELRRLVRRNDAAVTHVVVGGHVAAAAGVPADDLGRDPRYGTVLRVA
ncbi:MAG: amidohydrolase family protein [Nannocystaceae bacterium]|nr:amidohydrolase family protein [Nannocystaceae bacterium]